MQGGRKGNETEQGNTIEKKNKMMKSIRKQGLGKEMRRE